MRRAPIPTMIAIHTALFLFTCLTLYPVLWVITMALTPGQTFSAGVLPIPTTITLSNFREVLAPEQEPTLFLQQLANSLVVSTATSIVGLLLSATAGYALSRFRFPGRDRGMDAFLLTQMFPSLLMLIPLYMILEELNLLDTKMGLILVYATTSVPFSVFTLKGYFDTLPRELEEAALLDGCSRWTTFTRIVLPLSRPALAVTALFSFMTAWNEFILAATLINDPHSYTLPMTLKTYVGDYSTQWGHFAAGSLLVSAPVIALFFALQRHFVEGLTAGGVKG
jgi:arabinogalactan oligomer / maltooligosaccharide transport system permease protein